MNKVIIIVVIAVILVGAGAYLWHKSNASQSIQDMNMPAQSQSQSQVKPTTGSAQAAGKNVVTIQNFAFSPATITIKAGDSITWTNQDSVGHSATADDNSWDTGVLAQGQSKSITFSKAGTYTYHCSVHPNMKATVVVQ